MVRKLIGGLDLGLWTESDVKLWREFIGKLVVYTINGDVGIKDYNRKKGKRN